MPCPACHEWVVLFRDEVIAVDRRILQRGTFEQRKDHIAGIIARFLDPSVFQAAFDEAGEEAHGEFYDASDESGKSNEAKAHSDRQRMKAPITQEEVDRFINFELKRIDNPVYFRRHFG